MRRRADRWRKVYISEFERRIQSPFKHWRWSVLGKYLKAFCQTLHLRCLIGLWKNTERLHSQAGFTQCTFKVRRCVFFINRVFLLPYFFRHLSLVIIIFLDLLYVIVNAELIRKEQNRGVFRTLTKIYGDAFLRIKLTAKSCALFSQKLLITDVPLDTGHLMKSSESLTYGQFTYFLCPAGFDCHYYDNCCCYCYYYLIFCHWSLSVPPEKVKTPEDFWFF